MYLQSRHQKWSNEGQPVNRQHGLSWCWEGAYTLLWKSLPGTAYLIMKLLGSVQYIPIHYVVGNTYLISNPVTLLICLSLSTAWFMIHSLDFILFTISNVLFPCIHMRVRECVPAYCGVLCVFAQRQRLCKYRHGLCLQVLYVPDPEYVSSVGSSPSLSPISPLSPTSSEADLEKVTVCWLHLWCIASHAPKILKHINLTV